MCHVYYSTQTCFGNGKCKLIRTGSSLTYATRRVAILPLEQILRKPYSFCAKRSPACGLQMIWMTLTLDLQVHQLVAFCNKFCRHLVKRNLVRYNVQSNETNEIWQLYFQIASLYFLGEMSGEFYRALPFTKYFRAIKLQGMRWVIHVGRMMHKRK
jgi:hypothetical protein